MRPKGLARQAAQPPPSIETLAALGWFGAASASPRESPMAAAAPLRRLLLRLRKPPQPPLPIPLLPHIPYQTPQAPATAPHLEDPIPSQARAPNLRDLLSSFHPGLQIYPSLDPRWEEEDVVDGDGEGAEVWADSVKKKRKRKMNKHKLRKLRKRLRRQT
ncbi:hypothetical protein GUJ93_ZPchr0003g16874 [Zizania palustris]|uniref:Small ribosomal subunit protein mS38 n=1 Tax=Zizania palustris TaxID=103762 RepID=A0A8J5SB81_ZIZPA|nr:hypothetical protein GUJ93_ZPchr0003g16874 [Zizania palustris]